MSAPTGAADPPAAPPEAARPPTSPPSPSARRQAARRRRAARGTARVDRVDRVVLGLLGAIAVVVGAIGLAGPGRQPGGRYRDAVSRVVDAPDLALGVTLAACALVLAASLWWAWSQISPRSGDGRIATTTIARTPLGVTTIEPAAAAQALARDLGSVPGVHAARVRIVALGERPDLIATVDLHREADLASVRRELEGPLGRFAASTNARALDAELRFRATRHRPAKVR